MDVTQGATLAGTDVTPPTAQHSGMKSNLVPLSRAELLLGGISNLVVMFVGFMFTSWMDSLTLNHPAINNEADLSEFHHLYSGSQLEDTILVGVYLLAFPLILFQYFVLIRVLKVCFVKYHAVRTICSISYILYVIFCYMGTSMGVLGDAFNWNIHADTATSTDILVAANMIQLVIFRANIVFFSFACYFGAISMASFWSVFLMAIRFDAAYSNDLRAFILPKMSAVFQTILLCVLTFGTLIAAYVSAFAWSHYGFWSLSGGSQFFQIFAVFSSFVMGIWFLWFALSGNYQHFNDRIQFQQFL
eukprot:66742_1